MSTSVHLSIDVPDLEAGIAFYESVFDFKERVRPFPTMAILDGPNFMVCMHEKAEGTKSSQGSEETRHYARHWTPVHLDLHTPRYEQALKNIKALGGAVETELRNHGPKPVFFCADPFGNGFCVIGEAPD